MNEPVNIFKDADECSRDDLRIELSISVPVDGDGEAIVGQSQQLDPSGDRPYWCRSCQQDFKCFEHALDHVKKVA